MQEIVEAIRTTVRVPLTETWVRNQMYRGRFPRPWRALNPKGEPWFSRDEVIEWFRDRFFLNAPEEVEAFMEKFAAKPIKVGDK